MKTYICEVSDNWDKFDAECDLAEKKLDAFPDEIIVNPGEPLFLGFRVLPTVKGTICITRDPMICLGTCWMYSNRLLGPLIPICTHKWVTYEGLMTSFDYCEHCDKKKD